MSSQRVVAAAFRATAPTLRNAPRAPIMNRARTGLYHGKHIMFGNYVAHSERKVRRTWLPNLQKHKYRSNILDETLDLKVTTETMRNIDRLGGFDNYILKTPEILLGGPRSLGSRIKTRLTEAYQQKIVIDARLAELEAAMKKNQEALIQAQAKAELKAQVEALQKATGHGV